MAVLKWPSLLTTFPEPGISIRPRLKEKNTAPEREVMREMAVGRRVK